MNNVLSVKNLQKTYHRPIDISFSKVKDESGARQVHALKGISFDLPQGCITGFLGANGAGKTTTIKCLLGLAFADSGEIRFFGDSPLTPAVKARIGFLPERPYFYEYLTGREFLRFYGQLSGKLKATDLRARIDALLKRVGLEHASGRPLRSYSKGMLQRIGIAQALVHMPDLIILDEPQTGLDPDGRHEVQEIIRETAAAGTSVFFSSHLLPDAEQLCERLVILKKGDLVFQGPTKELLQKADVGYQVNIGFGERVVCEKVPTIEDLQKTIDKNRAAGGNILEVSTGKVSLEEAFSRIAMGGAK